MSYLRNGRRRHTARLALLGLAAGALVAASGIASSAPEASAATGCVSTSDCLATMTLAEKAGQMTQVANAYITNKNDIATYGIGSVLSGGGGGPNGVAGGTATQWADMVDDYQSYALRSRLGIPLLYGVDAVHGHNNVQGAVIFPHNIGMGASRDTALVTQEEDVTRKEVLGTGIRWAFAPCVCVPRDDRWGRTYEGFGEDPSIVSPMAGAAIRSSPRGCPGPKGPASPTCSSALASPVSYRSAGRRASAVSRSTTATTRPRYS